jgi:membrane-associated phospholipid phosphatase
MVIGRGRPKFFEEFGSHYFHHFHAPGYDFSSMPSGHSITIASIGIALMILLPRFKYLWLFMAVIVAFSRVAVSAHYPSDVVFGFYVGTYSSLFIYYWMKNRNIV